jgi:formamidopyrimidine-DNA glycosylase
MLEIPEAFSLSRQISETLAGKSITRVIAAESPHKFAWYHEDPALYETRLKGKAVSLAESVGGMVRIKAEDTVILFCDGVSLKYLAAGEKRPQKHQLLIEFGDGTALCASVQMYGGIWCFKEGTFDNTYYKTAEEKPSPLTEEFDSSYFESILDDPEAIKLSAKALLATGQRVPGLGNGVLQDVLFEAKVHPKKKLMNFSSADKKALYAAVKTVLRQMADRGGRDTEKDLFGNPGGYITKLSKNTAGKPCPVCGNVIKKEAYLGGSVYICESCQKL